MSASARRKANRQNASGPHKMTEAGKQTVRTNAIRHGLTSHIHVVLSGEDGNFYTQLLESLQAQYSPANTLEEMLVNQIAQHHWRLIRVRNMETGAFEMGSFLLAEKQGHNRIEPDDEVRGLRQSGTLSNYEGNFKNIARYEAAIERSYYRSIHELQKIQAQRIRSVSQNAASADQPAISSAVTIQPPVMAESVQIRSVRQNAESPATPPDRVPQTDSFCSATACASPSGYSNDALCNSELASTRF